MRGKEGEREGRKEGGGSERERGKEGKRENYDCKMWWYIHIHNISGHYYLYFLLVL